MILKQIENGIERVFYSQDIIEKIRSVNNELLEQYPECGEYCKAIEEVLYEQ